MNPGKPLEVNLVELNFPFLSTDQPRTALLTEIAQNVAEGSKARNKAPQIIAMKNMLPTSDGYCAVDQIEQIPVQVIEGEEEEDPDVEREDFEHAISITAGDGLDYLVAKTVAGVAISRVGTDEWTDVEISGLSSPFLLTWAKVDGEIYLHFGYTGTYKFFPSTIELEEFELIGLLGQQILGISFAASYFLAFDTQRLYWDSQVHRADFTPELGGAGSTQLSELRGKIVTCLAIANGFIIYTDTNAVGGQYTGNPNFPFVAKEIADSSGIRDQYNVSYGESTNGHLAWTKHGLMEVAFSGATLAFPSLTEFLNKKVLEDFAPDTGFVRTKVDSLFKVKMGLVGHRYITCSYGDDEEAEFQFALVYDLQLKRWGKLAIPHVNLFGITLDTRIRWFTYAEEYAGANRTYEELDTDDVHYNELNEEISVQPQLVSQIAALRASGQVNYYPRTDLEVVGEGEEFDSYLMLGPISWLKQGFCTLWAIEAQNLLAAIREDAVACMVFPLLDHDMFSDLGDLGVEPFEAHRSARVRKWLLRETSRAFLIYLQGREELTNLIVRITPAGNDVTAIETNTIGFEDTEVSAEEAGEVVIAVERIGEIAYPARISYQTVDGTALEGVNYTEASGQLVWTAGDGASKNISVTITDFEEDLEFTVVLSDPIGLGALLDADADVCTVLMDIPPILSNITAYTNIGAVYEPTGLVFGIGLFDPILVGGSILVGRSAGGEGAASVAWSIQSFAGVIATIDGETSGLVFWSEGDFADQTLIIDVIGIPGQTPPVLQDIIDFSAANPLLVQVDFVALGGCAVAIPGGPMQISPFTEIPDGSVYCTLEGS